MRSRNIKPAFFKNEFLGTINPLARLLYIGLWCYCDREGRFEWRPLRIKAEILPYDDCNIEILLNMLVKIDEIKKYKVDKKMYGFIPTFLKHQNPHMRETPSIYPPFDEKHNLGSDKAQPRQEPALLNPESLNPESLNPEYILSGKPDGTIYKNIINFLNKITDSHYKHSSKITRRLIDARINEGFTEEDFKYVIKNKAKKWLNDNGMRDFLRPQTLFSSKFESYRNEKEYETEEERKKREDDDFFKNYYKEHPEQAKKDGYKL